MGPRRILITGGTGLLGKALLETAPAGWDLFATFHQNPPPVEWRSRFYPLDTREEAAVFDLFQALRPEVVIHAASVGNVDEAEQNPQRVREVNVLGTQNVGRACLRVGALLVFISSNAVFDGKHPPYREEDPVHAANRYGELKIEAERWILGSGFPSLILRPILMYGWPFPGGRDNVVTRWLAQWEQGRPVEVASDIASKPLFAGNAAEAIRVAVRQQRTGIFHLAGADRLSLDAFARETVRLFGLQDRLVIPVLSRELSLPAPRPRDTSFDTTKMERELGVRPIRIREGLSAMLRTRAFVG